MMLFIFIQSLLQNPATNSYENPLLQLHFIIIRGYSLTQLQLLLGEL